MIRSLQPSKIPGHLRHSFAALCRRTHQPQIALRSLAPIVRPSRDRTLGGTNQEQVQYAATLIEVGATDEGMQLLDQIKSLPPDGLLYRAFGFVSKWEYGSSIPVLEKYVRLPEIGWYQRLVGNVNLAAALVVERKKEALSFLNALYAETNQRNLDLLKGHVLQLKAQWLIAAQEFDQAKRTALLARQTLRTTGGLDTFFAEKWLVVVNLLQSGGSPESLNSLERFKQEAIARGEYDNARDCELYRAVASKDESLVVRLCVGSPCKGYRERIFREFGKRVNVPSSYLWNPSTVLKAKKEISLLQDGRVSSGDNLILGHLIHRVLCILASDFYRPFRVASLYAALHPEAFYDPHSSANQIYELIKRVRKWLLKNRVPLGIKNFPDSYGLQVKDKHALWVSSELAVPSAKERLLDKIRRHFPTTPFSLREASILIKANSWTVLRALREAAEKGEVNRVGRGPSTRYHF